MHIASRKRTGNGYGKELAVLVQHTISGLKRRATKLRSTYSCSCSGWPLDKFCILPNQSNMESLKILEKKLDEALRSRVPGDRSSYDSIHSLIQQIKAVTPPEYAIIVEYFGMSTNSNEHEAHEPTISILNGIMEALVDANNNMIGVCRSNDDLRIAKVLEKVTRRIQRDNLFDVVVKAAVTKVPDLESIQEEISSKLNLKFDRETVAERASLLCDMIKKEQRILIILCDLWKGLDLGQVGIPFGVDHTGCKILLTSASEKILSVEMKAQKVFFLP